MKRIIALTLAILMVAALFCACGEKKKTDDKKESAVKVITATIEAKFDQGFAEKYAKSVTTDDKGNKVYQFDSDAYENYTRDYSNSISSKITKEVSKNHDSSFGQFCYINDEKKAVIVGVNPGQYNEEDAKAEAGTLAQDAFPYFKGLETPVDTVNVIYCNANNQDEVYGSFSFPIQ